MIRISTNWTGGTRRRLFLDGFLTMLALLTPDTFRLILTPAKGAFLAWFLGLIVIGELTYRTLIAGCRLFLDGLLTGLALLTPGAFGFILAPTGRTLLARFLGLIMIGELTDRTLIAGSRLFLDGLLAGLALLTPGAFRFILAPAGRTLLARFLGLIVIGELTYRTLKAGC